MTEELPYEEFPCNELGCKRVRCFQFTNGFLCYGIHPPNEYGDTIRECFSRSGSGNPDLMLDIEDMTAEEAHYKITGLQEALREHWKLYPDEEDEPDLQ